MEKVTSKNCLELYRATPLNGDTESQARAWEVSFSFMQQQKDFERITENAGTGLEKAIKYMEAKCRIKRTRKVK